MQQIVVFSLGDDAYCLSIAHVREIAPWSAPEQVAGAPLGIAGTVDLRGTRLPVCDLAAWLGVEPAAVDEERRVVVVEARGVVAGLAVDVVEDVLTVSEAAIDTAHVVHEAHVEHLIKLEDRLVVQLDAAALFVALGLDGPDALAA
jgi:purine-binding chemotaxis protein CheW